MQALNMQDVKDHRVRFDRLQGWPAIRFEYAYDALVRVLARKSPAARPPQPPLYVTPPGQTTVPANPNFSDSTTSMASSGSSESKSEHYTDLFANYYIAATLKVVQNVTTDIRWLNPSLGFYLSMTLFSSWICSCVESYMSGKPSLVIGI